MERCVTCSRSVCKFSAWSGSSHLLGLTLGLELITSVPSSRMWRKKNPLALLVGMQSGAAMLENSMEVPQKVKQ